MIACQICLQNFSRKRTLSNLWNPIVTFFLFHSQHVSSRALGNYLEQLTKFFKKFMITFVIYLVFFLSKISLNNISIRNYQKNNFLEHLCLALCDKSSIYTCFRLARQHLQKVNVMAVRNSRLQRDITEFVWISLS